MPDPITPESAVPGGPATEAEPVAWRFDATESQTTSYTSRKDRADHRRTIPGFVVTPLYAHPADAESLRVEVERLRAAKQFSADVLTARAEKAESERDAALARVAELENALAKRGDKLTAAWHQLDALSALRARLEGGAQ